MPPASAPSTRYPYEEDPNAVAQQGGGGGLMTASKYAAELFAPGSTQQQAAPPPAPVTDSQGYAPEQPYAPVAGGVDYGAAPAPQGDPYVDYTVNAGQESGSTTYGTPQPVGGPPPQPAYNVVGGATQYLAPAPQAASPQPVDRMVPDPTADPYGAYESVRPYGQPSGILVGEEAASPRGGMRVGADAANPYHPRAASTYYGGPDPRFADSMIPGRTRQDVLYPARDAPRSGPLIDNPAREFATPAPDPYSPVSGYTDPSGRFIPYGDRNAAAAGISGETSFRPAQQPPAEETFPLEWQPTLDFLTPLAQARDWINEPDRATAGPPMQVGSHNTDRPARLLGDPRPVLGGWKDAAVDWMNQPSYTREDVGDALGGALSGLGDVMGGVYNQPTAAANDLSSRLGAPESGVAPDTRMRDQFRALANPYEPAAPIGGSLTDAMRRAQSQQPRTGASTLPSGATVATQQRPPTGWEWLVGQTNPGWPWEGQAQAPATTSQAPVSNPYLPRDTPSSDVAPLVRLNQAALENLAATDKSLFTSMTEVRDLDGVKVIAVKGADNPETGAPFVVGVVTPDGSIELVGNDIAPDAFAAKLAAARGETPVTTAPAAATGTAGNTGTTGSGRPWVDYGSRRSGGYNRSYGGGYSRGYGGGYSGGGRSYDSGGNYAAPEGFGSGGGMFPEGFPFEGDEFGSWVFDRMRNRGGMSSAPRAMGKRSKRSRMRSGKRSGKMGSSAPTTIPSNAAIRDEVEATVKKRTKK